MRILVTGGSGVVGSTLVPELVKSGYTVSVFDRHRDVKVPGVTYHRGDICDPFRVQEIFSAVRPDTVIHLAGMVSRKECEETPMMAIQTNAIGMLNVITNCERYGSRLIYSGSSEEYGAAYETGEPVTEDTPFGHPSSIYSLTKRTAEELVQYYCTHKNLTATVVRFFMLYGPGEYPSEYRCAIIRFMDAAMKNEPLEVHQDTERSWCYLEDAVDAICRIVRRVQNEPLETYNIGRHEPVLTVDLALQIRELCGSSSPIRLSPPEATIIPIKRASFDKIREELGWEAGTDLQTGLERTYEDLVGQKKGGTV